MAAAAFRPRPLRRDRPGRLARPADRRRGGRGAAPSSPLAHGATTRSRATTSPSGWRSWSSSTPAFRRAGEASRTRSTGIPAGSRARSTRRGPSRYPSCPKASWSPTAARESPRASCCTVSTSPDATAGCTPVMVGLGAAPGTARRASGRDDRLTRSRRRVGSEIALPANGDLRCREPDEEHRSRRPRRRRQHHVHLVRQAVALAQVARRARGDDVLPDSSRRRASAGSRDRASAGSPGRAAVDAPPAVTGKERAARDLALHHARNPHVGDEANYVWPAVRVAGRAKWSRELFDHLRLSLEHEHVRAAKRAHIQGLVTGVQDQDLLHQPRNLAKEPASTGSAAHRAVDRLLLLGRQRHGGAAALELLHVDPGVVAALDRGDDDSGAAGVEQGEGSGLVTARVLVGVVRTIELFVTLPSTRRSTRASPAATSSTAPWRSSIRPWSETAKSTRSVRPPPTRVRCASRSLPTRAQAHAPNARPAHRRRTRR